VINMASQKKRKPKSGKHLVFGYLERISSKVFSDFPQELTSLVIKKHGVYALYKGDRLYYVGLATNLRNRIKNHLKDKHAGKWDKFSLYLVRKVDHIKELESLILRIADPKGNAMRGRLKNADNLKNELQAKIKRSQLAQLSALLGGKKSRKKKKVLREKVVGKNKTSQLLMRWGTLDTIICAAKREGFEQEFLGKQRWYAIRLNRKRIPFIKYIAMYQVHPISAITHYGEVDSIKPYKDTGKYMVKLKGPAKKIGPIPLKKGASDKTFPPQAPRFTSFDQLRTSESMKDFRE